MSAKTFLVVVVVALMLATSISPAMAATPKPNTSLPAQATTWSAPGSNLSISLPGRIQPNGDCEGGGNCSF